MISFICVAAAASPILLLCLLRNSIHEFLFGRPHTARDAYRSLRDLNLKKRIECRYMNLRIPLSTLCWRRLHLGASLVATILFLIHVVKLHHCCKQCSAEPDMKRNEL
jgi:hypothetical protein